MIFFCFLGRAEVECEKYQIIFDLYANCILIKFDIQHFILQKTCKHDSSDINNLRV